MKESCDRYRAQIGPALLDDLGGGEKQKLEAHLAACPDCRLEKQQLEQTLEVLASVDPVEVPRHFFVYDSPRRSGPVSVFRQFSLAGKFALVSGALLCLLFFGALLSSVQVRFDANVMTVAFGVPLPAASSDLENLRREFAALLGSRLEAGRENLLDQVQAEVRSARDELTEEQRRNLAVAFRELGSELETRLQSQAGLISEDLQSQTAELYRGLYLQHQADLKRVDSQLNYLNVRNEIQGSQTDALVSTLVQFADLQLRENRPGQ